MEKVKLTALGDYPDIYVEFEEVDIVGSADIRQTIKTVSDCKVVRAKKDVVVKAVPAKAGDVVDTRPRVMVDGKLYAFGETKQTITEKHVEAGAMLVQNPDGEVYVVKGEKFAKTYESLGNGQYSPKDSTKKFVKINKNICFKAPWGEMVYAPKGSMLCVEYIDTKDVYSITNAAFAATYKEQEQEVVDEGDDLL